MRDLVIAQEFNLDNEVELEKYNSQNLSFQKASNLTWALFKMEEFLIWA